MSETPVLHIRADQMQLLLAVVAAARKYRQASDLVGHASEPWLDLCRALDAYEASIRKRYEDAITDDEAVAELRRHGEEL